MERGGGSASRRGSGTRSYRTVVGTAVPGLPSSACRLRSSRILRASGRVISSSISHIALGCATGHGSQRRDGSFAACHGVGAVLG